MFYTIHCAPSPRLVAAGRSGISLFVDPPGREWYDFVHARNELVTVAEGRLEVKVAGSRFVAEPGDEVFIPKGALHSVKNVHVTATRWLYGYD